MPAVAFSLPLSLLSHGHFLFFVSACRNLWPTSQADELLREVRGDVQTTSAVAEKALSALAKALRKLPPRVVTAQEAGLLVSALGLTSEVAHPARPLQFTSLSAGLAFEQLNDA